MTVDTVLTPAEIASLPPDSLEGSAAVVFDILRATSSMVTGLANRIREIHAVRTIDEARSLRKQIPSAALGGERHGDRIEGFDIGNSPAEFCGFHGAALIHTTTNGTVALAACAPATALYAGSLLNLQATAEHVVRAGHRRVVLVCAGTFDAMAYEDVLAAGLFIRLLTDPELDDSSMLALEAARDPDWPDTLRRSRNARALATAGRGNDIDWCLQLNRYPIVAMAAASPFPGVPCLRRSD